MNGRIPIYVVFLMIYYRLRDIVTPPFAYILNRDEVVEACDACQLPFGSLAATLKVEICVNQPLDWENRLTGQPMMADHWLIGDEEFGNRLNHALNGHVMRSEVEITQWLITEPSFGKSTASDGKKSPAPDYYHYFPKTRLDWAADHECSIPRMTCQVCRRTIPDIPLDWQPVPHASDAIPFAGLNHFYFDGYDYLFHESVVTGLAEQFPNMLFEKLPTPSLG